MKGLGREGKVLLGSRTVSVMEGGGGRGRVEEEGVGDYDVEGNGLPPVRAVKSRDELDWGGGWRGRGRMDFLRRLKGVLNRKRGGGRGGGEKKNRTEEGGQGNV